MTSQPHDEFFAALVRHAVHAASWAAGLLPAALAAVIDWTTLAPAPEQLRRDLLSPVRVDALFAFARTDSDNGGWLLPEHK
ncbi:MAG: Rpn family recombination-promoting nuclease/putative transposase, partial [Planctomycetes bacterium]|nr:Rpn family recombination-promoting nuclease/putative transposase [Planctomycetota bacterium]